MARDRPADGSALSDGSASGREYSSSPGLTVLVYFAESQATRNLDPFFLLYHTQNTLGKMSTVLKNVYKALRVFTSCDIRL